MEITLTGVTETWGGVVREVGRVTLQMALIARHRCLSWVHMDNGK